MSKNRFSLIGDGKHSLPPSDDQEHQVVAELTTSYKELAALWEEAEERLRKFHIPVDVYIRYDSEDMCGEDSPLHPIDRIHSYLGFVRYGRGWRICFCANADNHPEYDFQWKPIVDCRVDIRLEAFPHIDKLRDEVEKAAKDWVPKLKEALTSFRDKLKNW